MRSINSAVPTALDRICRRAIARDPQDRYPSARALADELDGWLLHHKSGGPRLSFAISTIVMGVAAALLLVIGLQLALVPWGTRSTGPGPAPGTSSGADFPPSSSEAGVAMPVKPSVPTKEPSPSDRAGADEGILIGNVRKRTYHRTSCPTVKEMNPSNRSRLQGPEQAAALGLQPCGTCKPPRVEAEGQDAPDGFLVGMPRPPVQCSLCH